MRSRRTEAIFDRWLEERHYKWKAQTFKSFKDRCDAGEVEGLSPYDFKTQENPNENEQGDG